MFNIVILPVKPEDKSYPFYKKPREVLTEPDNVIESLIIILLSLQKYSSFDSTNLT